MKKIKSEIRISKLETNSKHEMLILLFVACACFICAVSVHAEPVAEGNAIFREGRFAEALRLYESVPPTDRNFNVALFNQGVARYMLANYDSAISIFARAAEGPFRFESQYNRGNSLLKVERWQDAVDAYKSALRIQPNNQAAKHNLCLALLQIQQIHQNDKKDSQQKKPDDGKDSSPNKGEGDDEQKPQREGGGGMNREMAERILEGLNDADREAQKNIKRAESAQEANVEKDW